MPETCTECSCGTIHERLQWIIQNIFHPILILQNNKILNYNKKFSEILNYKDVKDIHHISPDILEEKEVVKLIKQDDSIIYFNAKYQNFDDIQIVLLEKCDYFDFPSYEMDEDFVKVVINACPAAIFIKNNEGKYILANTEIADMHGVKPHELIGKKDIDFLSNGYATKEEIDAFVQADQDVIHKGIRLDIDAESYTMPDGTVRIYKTSKIPIDIDGEGPCVLGVAVNISDLQKRQKELEFMTKDLSESNQNLQQFAYAASHDLKEPLRVIANYCQLFQRKYDDKIDEDANKYLRYIIDAASRMRKMIDDILDFAQLKNGDSDKKEIDVEKILKNVLKTFKTRIKRSNVNIHIGKMPVIIGYESQIERIFQNLISNSLKFKASENPEIYVKHIDEEDYWHFMVEDNGIGINENDIDSIFLIFKRLHKEKNYPGTGIGLAVCKRIVDNHSGDIWAEKNEKKGVTFHFRISKKNIVSE